MVEIQIKKLRAEAIVPQYAHDTDTGMDLYSTIDITIAPKSRAAIPTGFAMKFPDDCVVLFWDKGGPALKGGITVLAGVGDPAFRGEYMVILFNSGDEPYEIKVGQKVAQMLVQPIVRPKIKIVDELDETDRGAGGFGSTGLFSKKS